MNAPERPSKVRRYREKKAQGLREVRMWVPDVDAPGFWERSVLAAAILREAPEEEETMCFIEDCWISPPDGLAPAGPKLQLKRHGRHPVIALEVHVRRTVEPDFVVAACLHPAT